MKSIMKAAVAIDLVVVVKGKKIILKRLKNSISKK
jgi:hypothetical protein